MNNINSIQKSVNIIRKYKIPYALLHCTNIYPTPPNLVRLEAMLELKKNSKMQLSAYQITLKLYILHLVRYLLELQLLKNILQIIKKVVDLI